MKNYFILRGQQLIKLGYHIEDFWKGWMSTWWLRIGENYIPYSTLSSPLCLAPCKFDKILVVGKIIEQNFIMKILVLEITS